MSKMDVEGAVIDGGDEALPVKIVTHLSEKWAKVQDAATPPVASGFVCGECGADNSMSVKDAVRCKMWCVIPVLKLFRLSVCAFPCIHFFAGVAIFQQV